MIKGVCNDCKEVKNLTDHSLHGEHKPPFIKLCWACHNARHNTKQRRFKRTQKATGGKYSKGTKKQHKR